jgi:hypothetical protein
MNWAIFILRWEDQLAVLCAKANKLFMRTVQQNVFLILNRVPPVTYVTDPELIRPSIPVMTHSLDQTVMARKAKARKCTAEIVGNITEGGHWAKAKTCSFSHERCNYHCQKASRYQRVSELQKRVSEPEA